MVDQATLESQPPKRDAAVQVRTTRAPVVFTRRSFLFRCFAVGASLSSLGMTVIRPLRALANPNGYQIFGYSTATGTPCNQTTGYARNHNCSPGCGSSPVYSCACNTSGTWINYHRGTLTSWVTACGYQWKLRPDECYAGSWDGWKWTAGSGCAGCDNQYWRCHDGYIGTQVGTGPSICRRCVSTAGSE